MDVVKDVLRPLGYEFRPVDGDNYIHMIGDIKANKKLIFYKPYDRSIYDERSKRVDRYRGHLCFYRGGLYGCDDVGCWRFVNFDDDEHVKYFFSTLGLRKD